MRLFISGVGTVTPAGLGLDALRTALVDGVPRTAEEVRAGEFVELGRVGRLQDKASAALYRRWGQLDSYSRYGFVSARQALEDGGFGGEVDRAAIGVLLGTAFGCMEENQKFDRFVIDDGKLIGASPLVFKGTVDNAPAGWVSVAFKLKGPNATFVSGDGAALEALWSAEGLLQRGRAPALLVGGVERFVDLHLLLLRRDPSKNDALLSEGSGILLVEREDSLHARGRRIEDTHAELLGVVRHRGSVEDGVAAAIARFGLDGQVGLVSLALPSDADVPALGIETVCDKGPLGESHGAWGGLAIAAAITRCDGGWGGKPAAVVHAFGEGNESFYAVLRASGAAQEVS